MILSILAAIALLGVAGDGATYIRAGNVFDGETFLGPQVVVVRNGRIEEVEDSGLRIPAGASVIDATDATVMPGLIDGHIRFMAPPKPYEDNIEKNGWGRLAAEEASAFPDNRRHLLLNGVTGIADMGGPLATYSGLRNALNRGSIIGPELYFSGPVITAPGGHPAGTIFTGRHDLIDFGTFQVTDTIAVREEVATLANEGVDFVEIVYDGAEKGTVPGSRGDRGEKGDSPSEKGRVPGGDRDTIRNSRRVSVMSLAPRLRLEVAQAAISLAHRIGVRVFAQVGSEEEARDMVRAGADAIEHGFDTESDSLLTEMAARGVLFTPSICAYVRDMPARVPGLKQTLRRAWELGVPLVIGTDFPASYGVHCGDDIFKEMEMFEDAGIPRFAVLRAATSGPAGKLGKADDLGRIASGYRANLVFIRGSADTGALGLDRVERVMLQGQTVVQDGRICASCEKGFRENSLSYLGYPYWDPLL
jgi:imidazolonepropionase-like amidohydrolase